jgi:hypothetical protein
MTKMSVFIIIGFCVLLIVPILFFLRHHYVKQNLERLIQVKYAAIKTLMMTLESGSAVNKTEVMVIAQNPALRITLFRMLETFGRSEVFPTEFYTEERGAESYMVNWLEFPTELGQAPDEILLMKIVTLEVKIRIHYYVFKFRTISPRWASKLEWMLGVCGPYNNESTPFDVPRRVFSRFNQASQINLETEVQWVHDNISP